MRLRIVAAVGLPLVGLCAGMERGEWARKAKREPKA